jgi:hypothetical protein
MQKSPIEATEIFRVIVGDYLSAYLASVAFCFTVEDLVEPTKKMFNQVAALVLPKYRVEYVKNICPQDIEEENKVTSSTEQRISILIKKLRTAIQ